MKIFNSIKQIFAIGAMALAMVVGSPLARAQGVPPAGTFQANNLNLPFSTLTASTTISTNLSAGWSLITTNNLVSTTWNSSSNAFVTVTNTILTTNTSFADMPIILQKDLALVFTQTASAAGTNIMVFARGLTTSYMDTNSPITITIGQTAAGTTTLSTNLSAAFNGGFGVVRLMFLTWNSGSGTLTNAVVGGGPATNAIPGLVAWAVKRNAW